MGQINLQVPVSGQPNSTEDPKISSDFNTLQTLLNGNIDPTNLTPTGGILHLVFRHVTSNAVAVAGDFIAADPSVTVTLPTPTTANQIIAIQAASSTTGATPVTVAGTNILGLGLNLASTFPLGTSNASVMLMSDGTTWRIVGGQQSTGWVAISRGANVNPGGGYTPAARVAGDMVELCGQLITASAGVVALGTVPSAAIPASSVGFPNTPVAPSWLIASGTGAITAGAAGGSGEAFNLDGLRYRLT